MLPRTSLIRVQRDLYQKMQNSAQNQIGSLSPCLKAYFETYQKEMKKFESFSTHKEVLKNILKSDLVLVGDYHTLSQSQRMLLRLMRRSLPFCRRSQRPMVLMLEMLAKDNTPTVEKYLRGKITEKTFLKKIQFQKHWGFYWPHYRMLFQFARENEIPIIGINANQPGTSLNARDSHAAKVVAEYSRNNPNALCFVLIGDLHLAKTHLPKKLANACHQIKIRRRTLTLHQNTDQFYWQLAETGAENLVDIVRVKKGVYCILNTPPWLKLQSHLQWNESKLPQDIQELDLSDDVYEYLRIIRGFLGIKGSFIRSRFEDFEIQGPVALDFLNHLGSKKIFTDSELKMLLAYIASFDSVFIPKSNYLFTSQVHVNQFAYLCSLYLHSKLSGFQEIFLSPKKDFYPFIFIEALGFLGSKIINPKRKAKTKADIYNLSRFAEGADTRNAAALAHQVLTGENPTLNGTRELHDTVIAYQATRWLGARMGEKLFENLIHGKYKKEDLRNLFFTHPRSLRLTPMVLELLAARP